MNNIQWSDLAQDSKILAATLQEMASHAAVANQRTQNAIQRAEKVYTIYV